MKTVRGEDGKKRCAWCMSTPEYITYHDTEWGVPTHNDRMLFEKLSLEAFQAGLSWRTILEKREGFRNAFKEFDFNKVSKFTSRDVARLLKDERIVRHRGKIEATIHNAKCAQALVKEFGSLETYFWNFSPRDADKLSKDLKKRGWKFVGPTTVYSFMQAAGIVNDHAKECFLRQT